MSHFALGKNMSTATLWQKHFSDVASVNLADKRVEGFFEALNQECLEENAACKFWQHENNGRVGKFPMQPNAHWFEITEEKFNNEIRFQ